MSMYKNWACLVCGDTGEGDESDLKHHQHFFCARGAADNGKEFTADKINPSHYKSHPSGIECIAVTRHMSFNIGNAIKYLWRCDLKNGIEDLKKAVWYIQDEINKREQHGK